MKKIQIKNNIPLYPMPTMLVGAMIDNKPNFLTVAWFSLVNFKPPLIAIVLNKDHYTNTGIRQQNTFSVNIPSADMVDRVDYCSIASGFDSDKSTLFTVFFGDLKTAPMISECPITAECTLNQTILLPTHEVFIGEITGTYSEEKYLTHGLPDITKTNPILFTLFNNYYWKLGEKFAKAMHVGKQNT